MSTTIYKGYELNDYLNSDWFSVENALDKKYVDNFVGVGRYIPKRTTDGSGLEDSNMYQDNINNIGIGTTDIDARLHIKHTTPTLLQLENVTAGNLGPLTVNYLNSVTPAVGDQVGRIVFDANNSSGVKKRYGQILCNVTDVDNMYGDMIISCSGNIVHSAPTKLKSISVGTSDSVLIENNGVIEKRAASGIGGGVTGLTSGYIPLANSSSTLTDSHIKQNGADIIINENASGTIDRFIFDGANGFELMDVSFAENTVFIGGEANASWGKLTVYADPSLNAITAIGEEGMMALSVRGSSTADLSEGASIRAGTSDSDVCAVFASVAAKDYFEVRGDGTLLFYEDSTDGNYHTFRSDSNNHIKWNTNNTSGVVINSDNTEFVFNGNNSNLDFKVRGQTDSQLFSTDAGRNTVSIGATTPYSRLSLKQSTGDHVGGMYYTQSGTNNTWSISHFDDSTLRFGYSANPIGVSPQLLFTNKIYFKNTGKIGIKTDPDKYLDIVTGTETNSAFHVGESANVGAYITSINDSQCTITAGAEYVAGSWYARASNPTQISMFNGDIVMRCNTGESVGSPYSTNTVGTWSTTGLTIATGKSLTSPTINVTNGLKTDTIRHAGISYVSGAATTYSLLTGGAWYQLDMFNTNMPDFFETSDHINDKISCNTTGTYKITMTLVGGPGSTTGKVCVAKGDPATASNILRSYPCAGTLESICISFYSDLTSSDDITAWMSSDSGGETGYVHACDLSAEVI